MIVTLKSLMDGGSALMVRKALHSLWLLFATVIIVIALILSLTRLLSPFANSYRPQIVQFASQLMGQPVTISRVSLGWAGFSPILHCNNVIIFDHKGLRSLLQVKRLDIGFNPFRGFHNLMFQHGYIAVRGAHTTVYEKEDGSITIDGVQAVTDATSGSGDHDAWALLEWLFSQEEISLHDVHVQIINRFKHVIPIDGLNVHIVNRGDNHHFEGFARLAQTVPSRMKIAGDLQGDVNDPKSWSGKIYTKTQDILLAQWLESPIGHYKITSGRVDAQLWTHIKDGVFERWIGSFSGELINITDSVTNQSVFLRNAAGDLSWARNAKGWQLRASHLQITAADIDWPNRRLVVTYIKHADNKHQYDVKLNHLRLNPFFRMLRKTGALSKSLDNQWSLTSWDGELDYADFSLTLNHPIDDENSERWTVRDWFVQTDFDLRVIPALNHIRLNRLRGSILASRDKGDVIIGEKGVRVTYPDWFKNPVQFNNVSVALFWKRSNGKWHVEGHETDVDNALMHYNGDFSLDLDDNALSNLSIIGEYAFKDLSQLKHYVPLKLVSEDFAKWFETAIPRGRDMVGRFVFRGNPNQFPFESNEGIMLADLALNDFDLLYQEKWPEAKNLSMKIRFKNDAVVGKLLDGNVLGIGMKDVSLRIPHIGKAGETLYFDGKLFLTFPQGIAFLMQSPLAERFDMLRDLEISGDADLSLGLSVNLDTGETKVKGNVLSKKVGFRIPHWGVSLTNINGRLHFSEKEIMLDNAQGEFLGFPVKIDIFTVPVPGQGSKTQVELEGEVGVAKLKERFTEEVLKAVRGTLSYRARLEVPPGGRRKKLTIVSDLRGVNFTLPPPFEQGVLGKQKMKVTSRFAADKPIEVRIEIPGFFSVAMTSPKPVTNIDFDRGEIVLGKEKAKYRKEKGFIVRGHLEETHADEWVDYFRKRQAPTSAMKNRIHSVDVSFDKLIMFEQVYYNLRLKGKRKNGDAWHAELESPRVSGEILIPDDLERGLRVRFNRLFLTDLKRQTDDIPFTPTNVPPLDIIINDLRYEKTRLGWSELQTQPQPTGMAIRKLTFRSPAYTLHTRGTWRFDRTRLHGSLLINNLGEALQQWHMPRVVASRSGQVRFDLSWPRAPYELRLADINGRVDMQLKKGKITQLDKETEAKIGIGKFLSILSLQTLPQRLTLDFSDLDRGFGFSIFSGTFNLRKGSAYTKNTFLDGPVAYVAMHGRLGLARQDYDVRLKVAPRIFASLPVVATIAGGPIAGAVAWVVGKFVNRQIIKQVTSYSYHITGSWTEPTIKETDIQAKDIAENKRRERRRRPIR